MNIIKDKEKINNWLKIAKEERFNQMLIIYNEKINSYYPVFCSDCEINNKIIDDNISNGRIQEVYDLNLDLNEQMNEERAFHYNKVLSLKK